MKDQLPPNVTPQMGPISSIMGQIVLVAVTGEQAGPMEVREAADFVIRPRLLTIPGVAQVIPIGGEVRQFRVSPNPAAMRALGVGNAQLETALQSFGTNAGGGFTDQYAREFLIRNLSRTMELDDLRNLVVATLNGRPVYLRQVAEVSFAAKVKRGDAGFMGAPAVVVLDEPNANVDTEGEAALTQCVLDLKARKCTVIMITHRAGLVRISDYVATMSEGQLVGVQRAAEFMAQLSPTAVAGGRA